MQLRATSSRVARISNRVYCLGQQATKPLERSEKPQEQNTMNEKTFWKRRQEGKVREKSKNTHQILQPKRRAHRDRILHVLSAALEEGWEAVDRAAGAVLGEEGAAGREGCEGGRRSAVCVDGRGGARDEVCCGRDACGQAGDELRHVARCATAAYRTLVWL